MYIYIGLYKDIHRTRLIRRNPNLSHNEVTELHEQMKSKLESINSGDNCPLCYDPFTTFHPFIKLDCNHHFHNTCIKPMLIEKIKYMTNCDNVLHMCPMCRDEFATKRYKELTGDDISSISEQTNYRGC